MLSTSWPRVTGPLWALWCEGRLGVDRVLPISTAEHVLRVLIGEGKRGAEILEDPTWRIFLCTPNDVADVLTRLSQTRLRREQRRRLHGRHSVWAAHANTQAVWVAQQLAAGLTFDEVRSELASGKFNPDSGS